MTTQTATTRGDDQPMLVDPDLVAKVVAAGQRAGGQFTELFVEDVRSLVVSLDDGRVEDVVTSRDVGAGIRVVVGETTGFAHTADLSERGLLEAVRTAAGAAARAGADAGTVVVDLNRSSNAFRPVIAPATIAKATKVDLLRRADTAARGAGAAIVQVGSSYSEAQRRRLIANSQGVLADDDLTKTYFAVSCVAKGDTGLQTGREAVGHVSGFELFDRYQVEELSRDAAARALRKLDARPAPSGTLPVVIASGSGGILFHEACGHGLEADLVAKGASVFAGRKGEKVASSLVTVVDDGTMAGEWGYLSIDDEGQPTQRNVLIENGVLTDYLWDFLRARKEGRVSSGNGRRQSYRHLPMVRMTNTYIAQGPSTPEEIIADTDHGVYVARLGGGQVNTATGDFVFGMTEAYLIRNGEIAEPLREGNLIGNGPDALAAIDAVANDFSMGGPGTCGKDGQGVGVGTGTPTLRVPALTVGGTAS